MALESGLMYLVALAVPVWLVVEQVMILRRSAARAEAQAPLPHEASSGTGTPGAEIAPASSRLRRKAA